MVRAIILDLDNCIAAADEPGRSFFEPVFQAIRQADKRGMPEENLKAAFEDMWRHPLDWVAQQHGFSEEMFHAGWKASIALEVPGPLRGYGDLPALLALKQSRFIVTSGFRRLQESKFRALRLEGAFKALIVDAIDEPGRLGKQGWFERILSGHHLAPDEVLVVGDNPDSEIAAGLRLGIPTVQTLRPGVCPTPRASFRIHSFHELRTVLQSC
jgi:putative hydrolase of the HAD superfamily